MSTEPNVGTIGFKNVSKSLNGEEEINEPAKVTVQETEDDSSAESATRDVENEPQVRFPASEEPQNPSPETGDDLSAESAMRDVENDHEVRNPEDQGQECIIYIKQEIIDEDENEEGASLENQAVDGKNHVCYLCNKRFAKLKYLKTHEKRHVRLESFSCKYCDKKFSEKSSLLSHHKLHTGEEIVSCEVCNRKYTEKKNLNRHLKRWHPEQYKKLPGRTYHCRDCDESFSQREDLLGHRKMQHMTVGVNKGLEPPVIECGVCLKKFAEKKNVKRHFEMTHPESLHLFLCDLCNQQFYSDRSLNYHFNKIHTVDKPFICNDCNASFAMAKYLQRHRIVHDGTKNFECSFCNQKYFFQSHLVRHQRIHTGEKPFLCGDCDMRFMLKSHLTRHVKRKHVPKVQVEAQELKAEPMNYMPLVEAILEEQAPS